MKTHMPFVLCLLFPIAFIGSARANFIVQWRTEDGGNGHSYELVTDQLTWDEAKLAAENRGGHLVTFSNRAEETFVLDYLFRANSVTLPAFIGLTDSASEGTWRWVDATLGVWQDPTVFGNPIQTAYTNWGPGEPNGGVNENYALLNWNSDGTWNDGRNDPGPGGNWYSVVEYDGNSPSAAAAPAPPALVLVLSSLPFLPLALCVRRNRS